tara:strand:+ start:1067 stop:1549 length:483 start_codon:yes stop_codon:yes gene_type:complete
MKKTFLMICALIAQMYSLQAWASGVRIIDADTIELDGGKVRLYGIDAPEMKQSCEDSKSEMYRCGISSKEALQFLIDMMPDKIVRCRYTTKDVYGRLIGECSIGKININSWLVENGWALAYRKSSKKYVKNENIAKQNRAGIWSGKFIESWKWRRGKRLQ